MEDPKSYSGSKCSLSGLPDKFRSWFDQFLGVFMREVCTKDMVRPLPPMIGNGQRVDLFQLFWVVRTKGGFDCVSDDRVWDLVAGDCGLGSGLGGAVKLVYSKYLCLLDRLLENKDLEWSLGSRGAELRKQLADLQEEFAGMILEVGERNANMAGYVKVAMSRTSLKEGNEEARVGGKGVVGLNWDSGNVEEIGKLNNNEEVKSEVVESGGGRKVDDDDNYVDVVNVDPANMEVSSCRKRKLESFCGLLNWLRLVAANSCDLSIGCLPERSKWKSYGDGENWKRVLAAREALCVKKNADSVAEKCNGQSNLRIMHPSMYDDPNSTPYNLRERQRLEKQQKTNTESGPCALSSPDSDSSESSPSSKNHVEVQVRVGSRYQAHVPDWTGVSEESDGKWLGTQIWPLEKPEQLHLIDRGHVGKGRQESCGCQMPGSFECVRFHTAEKRLKVKRELGSAFYHWKFTEMGEEVGLPWTVEEENKFKAVIDANPPSLGTTFWDDMIESFPKKSWRELVSFYFNVYHLQRRGYQNRFTPNDINSDDEDIESGDDSNDSEHDEPISSKSILKSPHKPHGKRT